MKEAVNFLRTVYSESVKDIATIIVAEAEGEYLCTVRDYVDGLIEKL